MSSPSEFFNRLFSRLDKTLWGSTGEVIARPSAHAVMENAFQEDSTYLLWLAEVITGDSARARQCVIDARLISEQHSGLFVDWLAQWARTSTIMHAIGDSRTEIMLASQIYQERHCPHGGHAPTTTEQIMQLRQLPAEEIVRSLDAFVRAIALLRGVSHCALQDCALRLGTTRYAVAAASCELDRWLHSPAVTHQRGFHGMHLA